MSNQFDEDEGIEIIYWGEEDEGVSVVNSEKFKKKRRRRRDEPLDLKKEIKGWIKLAIIAVLIAVFINSFIIINAEVPSGSMEKTIHEESRMMGFRLSYIFSRPERKDIIIFKYPDDKTQNYVKRVIGMPGEYIEVRNGIVYINDEPLEEDYVYFSGGKAETKGDFPKTKIPENSYFVMGDNRNNSKDSRSWESTNFVHEDLILGKAVLSYWPKIYVFD